MPDKVKGTVKWFSNRKGFGFITPSSDNAPTEDDIFVHQSGIVMETTETYRTLKDGFEVEFEVITDDSGKLKAENVRSTDGSPCPPPGPRERRRRKKPAATDATNEGESEAAAEPSDENEEEPKGNVEKKGGNGGRKKGKKKTGESKGGHDEPASENDKAPKKPTWDSTLDDSVKEGLESRKLRIVAGKAFLAIGDARLKLGTGGYAAFAHASGVIGEGTFTCDTAGKISVTWNQVLKLDGSEWIASTADAEKAVLPSEISLADDAVQPIKGEKANKPVWGEDKPDPQEALEANSFLMRKVVFHHGRGPRRRNRAKRNNTGKNGDETGSGQKVETAT